MVDAAGRRLWHSGSSGEPAPSDTGLPTPPEATMTSTCKDTALVRLSDAAGFETPESRQRERQDTRWLDQIISETATVDDLLDILERGFFTCRIDSDGDIVVRDVVNFYIHPASDGLLLTALFDFREGLDHAAMQAVAHAANGGEWMVRYRLCGEDELFLRAEHYMVLKGGITARNFGHTLRRFVTAVFQQMRGAHREVIA
ncbi:MAG: YbjN domain-containing protein [Rhodocyclaceae bacterium]|nr:YbjN domain-containing protein [Rhodocyclaceae bacterium]